LDVGEDAVGDKDLEEVGHLPVVLLVQHLQHLVLTLR
jgi:hypothetical protein